MYGCNSIFCFCYIHARFTITSTRTTEEDLHKDWKVIQEAASCLMKEEKYITMTSPAPGQTVGKSMYIRDH